MEAARARTSVLDDARGEQRALRVTWHPASSKVVFSHWNGAVCTASTPVELTEASRLIDLLVGALRDAATAAPADIGQPRTGWFRRLFARTRPALATMKKLPERGTDRACNRARH